MSSAAEQIAQLRASIIALEAQRAVLGNDIVATLVGSINHKLEALQGQPPEPQRKQVTILLADLSGFTAMAETMDAEEVARVMNDLWVMLDSAIVNHGGRIDKHIGDAVMAIWGAETGREDDPERAVRAALGMQAALEAFEAAGPPATKVAPHGLAIRIGVSTGPVLLSQVGTVGEFTAIGEAVNVASQLERACPPGHTLIAHDTYRHIRGIFDVQPHEPLVFRGRAEPTPAYVVLQAKSRGLRMPTRGLEGIETRMIGRAAEMLAMQAAYEDAIEASETRVVTVVGEAGVGKSRLLYEFDNWLELRPERILYFKGRATPNTQHLPYSLFRDLFANRFNILDSDGVAVALDKFRRGMDGALEPDLADVVGHWLGFDFSSSAAVSRLLDAPGFMATARAYLTRYWRAIMNVASPVAGSPAEKPVVILLEDVHWADDQSLDLAAYLATAVPAARLLIVAVTRAALFERRPNWGEGQAAFHRITLSPLSKRASRALVDEILQRADKVPDTLRDLIIETAEGNPFYVEEMVKMLIEQGVIERGEEGARGQGPGSREEPSSLEPGPWPLA
nr:AAA family ATPase [Promineifilum sp.]